MARKRPRRITSSHGSGIGSSGARKQTLSLSILPGSTGSRKSALASWQKQQLRLPAFGFLRFRRKGDAWEEAENLAGIDRQTAETLLPSAFFRDERGQLQVRGYDRYTRTLKIPTVRPGEFRWLRARGSRQASLIGTWNNAVKAAGRDDFSLIDEFPRNVYIDGVRLPTSHREVSRIAAAVADSDQPFEDIYASVGGA
jgi:hypothetical protein